MKNELNLSGAEIAEIQKGTTLHHVEGGTQIQFADSDVHSAYLHTGGAADIEAGNAYIKPGISANNPYAAATDADAARATAVAAEEFPVLDVAATAYLAGDVGRQALESHEAYYEAHRYDIPSDPSLPAKVEAAPQNQEINPPSHENYNSTGDAY